MCVDSGNSMPLSMRPVDCGTLHSNRLYDLPVQLALLLARICWM